MFCCRGTNVAAPGFPRCGRPDGCASGDELGCGDRDCDCGSYVESDRRCSLGTDTGDGDEPDAGAPPAGPPPERKKACKSIFFSGAAAGAAAGAALAGTLPNAFGAPLSSAGGAAGDDESLAFLSPAVPKETVQ